MGAVQPPSSPQVPAVRSPMAVPGPLPQQQHQPRPQPQTAGQPQGLPQQPKSRIDPNQIPSPIQVQDQDQLLFSEQYYGTCSKGVIPLSTTQVRVVDQGMLIHCKIRPFN